jgi:hypothetical protein
MPRWSLTLFLLSAAAAAAGLPEPGPLRTSPLDGDPPMLQGEDGCLAASLAPYGPTEVVVNVRALAGCGATRAGLDLALVLDTSGSMAADGKLDAAKAAAHSLLDHLSADDRVALVTFDDGVDVLRGYGAVDARIRAMVDGLSPDGATALQDAVLTAASLQGREGRTHLVVLTDGRDNRGARDLSSLVPGPTISTVGLGQDYDEAFLSTIAEATGGSFHRASTGAALSSVFAGELDRAQRAALDDIALHLVTAGGEMSVVHLGDLGEGGERKAVVPLGEARWQEVVVTARSASDGARLETTLLKAASTETTVWWLLPTEVDHGDAD